MHCRRVSAHAMLTGRAMSCQGSAGSCEAASDGARQTKVPVTAESSSTQMLQQGLMSMAATTMLVKIMSMLLLQIILRQHQRQWCPGQAGLMAGCRGCPSGSA